MQKEPGIDNEGREVMKCGFKIGGGIDQDYKKSPQGYTDNVSNVKFKTILLDVLGIRARLCKLS